MRGRRRLSAVSRAVQSAFGRHGPRHYLAQLKRVSLGARGSLNGDGMDGTARLGIDFGGVFVGSTEGAGRVSSREVDSVLPLEGALSGARRLSAAFGGRIWIISKASADTEAWTRTWLHRHGFVGQSCVPVENIVFVRERGGKRAECESRRITHLVDDRAENLASVAGVVDHLYLFGATSGEESGPDGVTRVPDWSKLIEMLGATHG